MINSFDAVVALALIAAMALGFRSGLLRSAATIVGYLLAMPLALWITSWIAPRIDAGGAPPQLQNSVMFFAVFLICGIVLGGLLRLAIDDLVGDRIGVADRLGGAVLGAVRTGLVAITLVLIFEALIPAQAMPPFLAGSRLQPLLSAAGQRGVRSLPPETLAYIERLKRAQRI